MAAMYSCLDFDGSGLVYDADRLCAVDNEM
jgi:hypothetical protein